MIPLGIIASAHKFAAAVGGQSFTFNTRTYSEVFNTGTTETTNTVSLTAGSEGDLAILWDFRINGVGTTVPSEHNPYGWVPIDTFGYDSGNEFRHDFSWKILTASDVASGTVTTGEAENLFTTILFFTPAETLTAMDHFDFESQGTTGNASLQTQNITTLGGIAPALAFGIKSTHFSGSPPSATFTSPTWDGDFLEEVTSSEMSVTTTQSHRIGYAIQNTTLTDLSVDSNDEGNAQQLISFHMTPADKELTPAGSFFNSIDDLNFTQGVSNRLMILFVMRQNVTSTAMPNALAPSGWTEVIDVQHDAGQEFRLQVFAKIRQPDEATVVLNDGSEEQAELQLYEYNANFPMSSINVGSTAFENTSGDASPQSQTVTTSGVTVPVVVGGMKVTFFGHQASFTSPTWDASIVNNPLDTQPNTYYGVGILVQNGTGSDVTVDSADQGAMQTLLSFHLEVD